MKVPAGMYWLGDPCYCFSDLPEGYWRDIYCPKLWEDHGGVFEIDGVVHVAFDTYYGDGTYEDQFGNKFPVDAGLIGLTPVRINQNHPFGVILVVFNEETEVSEDNGVLTFGQYVIDTKGDSDDNDYYGNW